NFDGYVRNATITTPSSRTCAARSPDSIAPSSTPTRRFPGPVPAGGRHAFSCSCSSLSSSASDWRPGPDSTPGPWTCSPRPSTGERALATASPPPLSPYSGSMSGLSEEQTRRVVALAMDLARQGWTEELLEFLDHGLPANTQDEDANSLLMLAV